MGSMVLPNPFLPMQKPVSAVFKTSFPKMHFGLSATKSINHSWWSKITEIAKLVFKTRKPVSTVSKTGFLMPAFGFQAPQSDLQRPKKTQHGPQICTWASETPRQLSPLRFESAAGASHRPPCNFLYTPTRFTKPSTLLWLSSDPQGIAWPCVRQRYRDAGIKSLRYNLKK